MIAYLDCVGGLAGDMLLAALIDAGAPERALRAVPGRLGLEDVELKLERVQRNGIGAVRVEVVFEGERQPHRSWRSIQQQLAGADLDERARARAMAAFAALARVEGAIHGVSPEEVHFHELGAVDTLIDIVGAVALLLELGVERVVCSPLPVARGVVHAAHGQLPLPAPATAALLVGAPIYGVELEAELVTPTGAALASTLASGWGPAPEMTVARIGYGAGSTEVAGRPNLLRVWVGTEAESELPQREVVLLETNLDDLSPELVPDAVEDCLAAGALDVWTVATGMKKGRPGIVLSALARPERQAAVARTILEQTTALGVRIARLRRYELEREEQRVEVDGRPVRVKLGRLEGRVVNVAPEHDDCAAVARATGAPIKSVWAAALAAARELT